MKNIILCILFLGGLHSKGQSVFNRVRNNLFLTAANKTLFDSCMNKGYCKDSVLLYRGLIELKQNDALSAKNTCKELVKTFPDFYEAHYLGGLIYLANKNYGKSAEEFGVLLQKSPKHIKALYNRALAFGMMEQYDKAIEDLSACIALKPMYSQAYYSRGYWNELRGNFPEAVKDYETTINLDPKNYDAYLGLAYIYRGLKSTEKSCETITNAIKAGSQIAEEVKDNFCR